MLDFSLGELAVVAAVAVLFIRPEDLPAVLRAVGKGMAHLRTTAQEFRGIFEEAARDPVLAETKREWESGVRLIEGDDGELHEAYDMPHASAQPTPQHPHAAPDNPQRR